MEGDQAFIQSPAQKGILLLTPPYPGRLDGNRADIIRRAADAVAMRAAGATYDEIAEKIGYADRTTASRAVRRQIRRMIESPEAKELRALEEIRLDTLQAGHWDQAVSGNPDGTKVVLKIMEQRAKLLGLNLNESRAAGALEASAVADLAAASQLQANLINAMSEAGVDLDQQDRVIVLLNARIGEPKEDDHANDIEAETVDESEGIDW